MIEISICNLRKNGNKVKEVYDIKVDRTSVLGNKFIMRSEQDRDKVCEQYKVWFTEQIELKNELVLNELRRIYRIMVKYGKLNLWCWCAPKRCHAETIKSFLENAYNNVNNRNLS